MDGGGEESGSEAGEEGGSEADRTKEEARQGGGREGWPFETCAALKFKRDSETIQVWSKI